MELTDHHGHLVAVPTHRRPGPVEAVVMEVPDQVSDLQVAADLQDLSPVEEEDPEVVAPAVHPEVDEETRIIEADFLIQKIITKNGKVV